MENGAVEEIFQKVPENDPVTMCTPLVVQTKAKICTDTHRRIARDYIRSDPTPTSKFQTNIWSEPE